MRTTVCFAVALFALTLNLGCFAKNSVAQQSSFNNDLNDTIELIPYGNSSESLMRRNHRSPRPSPYGRSDMTSNRSGYATQFQDVPPYRSAKQPGYRAGPNLQYDSRGRQDYETRREDFTYATNPDSGYSSRGERGHGGCHGSCSHGQRGGAELQRYENNGRPGYDGESRNEADQAPQLSLSRPGRRDPAAAYARPRDDRSIQTRQEYLRLQRPGGANQQSFATIGPPPASFGTPNGSGSSGCGHAGCNHDHN